ncbi:unnamed protein product [Discosporangium mesarthrocarpum]
MVTGAPASRHGFEPEDDPQGGRQAWQHRRADSFGKSPCATPTSESAGGGGRAGVRARWQSASAGPLRLSRPQDRRAASSPPRRICSSLPLAPESPDGRPCTLKAVPLAWWEVLWSGGGGKPGCARLGCRLEALSLASRFKNPGFSLVWGQISFSLRQAHTCSSSVLQTHYPFSVHARKGQGRGGAHAPGLAPIMPEDVTHTHVWVMGLTGFSLFTVSEKNSGNCGAIPLLQNVIIRDVLA